MKRIVNVIILKKNGEFVSTLILETSKYDNIGFTYESLSQYMNDYILANGKIWYISRDRIINS